MPKYESVHSMIARLTSIFARTVSHRSGCAVFANQVSHGVLISTGVAYAIKCVDKRFVTRHNKQARPCRLYA